MVESSEVRNRRIKFLDDEDRISELPDSIIQHILSLLPSTKEAIRTGILSRRWRNQWTHVPLLIFRPPYDPGDEHKYLKFIETTLILHDCPKIKKFHLEYDFDYNTDPQFSSKVHFAIRKCVEELILICENPEVLYSLPRVLFDSASLVRLEMVNCPLVPNWKVNWPSLKSLKINGYYHDNNRNKGVENILSGSPLLERLELYECDLDNVAIVSKSLKFLCFVNVEDSTGIRISCPNLVEFNVVANGVESTLPEQLIESVLSGSPFIHSLEIRCCIGFNSLVIASKSLKVLSIQGTETTVIEVVCPNLEKLDFSCWRGERFKAVNLPSSICATIDYYYYPPDHNSVKEMLEQFQHVKKLTIGRSLCRNVSKLVVEDRLSLPLLNCKCLTVNVDDNFGWAVPGIAYALRSPMLEALVINVEFTNYQDTWDEDLHDYWNSYGCSGLSCLVSQLKTVKIIGLRGKDRRCKLVFEFIEFLLKNARVLETMIVEFKKPREGYIGLPDLIISDGSTDLSCLFTHLKTFEMVGLNEKDD